MCFYSDGDWVTIIIGVLEGDTLEPFLSIIRLDYVQQKT